MREAGGLLAGDWKNRQESEFQECVRIAYLNRGYATVGYVHNS